MTQSLKLGFKVGDYVEWLSDATGLIKASDNTMASQTTTYLSASVREKHRWSAISARIGSREKLADLDLACDLLKASPSACKGCPMNPAR